MAYVVARPRGRWEIRESFSTPEGPRARTLVTFSELSDDVIARAARRSETPFNPEDVRRAARRAGVPFERNPADALAEELVRRISHGQNLRPGLARLLRDRLEESVVSGRIDESLGEWIGASSEERGAALVDLLGLADHLPKSRPSPLEFPGLSRARLEKR